MQGIPKEADDPTAGPEDGPSTPAVGAVTFDKGAAEEGAVLDVLVLAHEVDMAARVCGPTTP